VTTDHHQPPHSRPDRPTLRIVRGDATAEEIAALLTVLTTPTTTATTQPTPPPSTWADHQHRIRHPLHPSPHGWRTSAFPR
jgi:hypothetical protein